MSKKAGNYGKADLDEWGSVLDDDYVHVTTYDGARKIFASGGLDPKISGYVTRWKSIKNITDAADFNTKLYSQSRWSENATKFNEGAIILKIKGNPKFVSPRTNWVDGVPQYRFDEKIPNGLIIPIFKF